MSGDANHDGKLSKDEVPAPIAERIFERADTNHDGFLDKAELTAFAQNQPRGPGGGPGGGQGGPEGRGGRGGPPQNLEGSMKQVGRAAKSLSKSAFDAASRASDLDLVQSLQGGFISSKGNVTNVEMSPAAKAKFGEDKAAFQTEFRRYLLRALSEATALETAILDGKGDEARAIMGRLKKAQDAGHDLFKEPEEDEGGGERRPPAGAGEGRRQPEKK